MCKRWFFNVVYCGILLIFSPMLIYQSLRQGKYREGFRQKFFGRIPKRKKVLQDQTDSAETKVVWFHAVSVGEVKLLQPLLQNIRQTLPHWHCTVSTTSKTGMVLAKQLYSKNHIVFYCPLDFSWAVEKALTRLKPDLLVLTEQELWFNLVDAASRHKTKIAIINGRFGESGYKRYLWIRPFAASLLRKIDLIAAQNEVYAGWFRRLGASAEKIRITGSIKFDGAAADRNNSETVKLRSFAGIEPDDIVFLAGSTQQPEELFAVQCYEHLKTQFPKLRLILVPRHPERFREVAAMLETQNVQWQRRSALTAPQKPGTCPSRTRILLVDTIGELGAWWGTAAIAYVGGSMGSRGGQNMIEPAAYGAAVCFGPKTRNFRDIVEMMLRENAAEVVHDQHDMEMFVRKCLEQPEFAAALGKNAKKLVQDQTGATQRTLESLQTLFDREKE